MKRTLTAAVAISAALLLAGCSANAEPSSQEPASSSTPAPLVATPDPTVDAASATDAAFLAAVREAQAGFATQIPDATDEQLLEVGAKACAELEAGTDTSTLSLIDGETPNVGGYFNDSAAILTAARISLCPA